MILPVKNIYSQAIHTGIYNWGTMLIAVDSISGRLSGYYENSTGIDEQAQTAKYTCIFLFSGKYSAGEKNIPIFCYSTFGKDSIAGEIMIESDKKIRMKFEREPNGCPNVEKFTEKLSPVFQFTEKEEWKRITAVKNEKVFIYNQADEMAKTRRYFVKGDCIKILEEKGNWLKVDFGDASKIVIAWIKKEDAADF